MDYNVNAVNIYISVDSSFLFQDSEPDEKFSVSIKDDAAYTVAGNPVTVTISRSDRKLQ